jgi:hypothetical protein
MFRINGVLATVGQNLITQRVLADEPGGHQRERRTGTGEINKDVVGRAAGALRLAADISELLRLRIHVYDFDLVNDPVSTGEQSAVAISVRAFHGGHFSIVWVRAYAA